MKCAKILVSAVLTVVGLSAYAQDLSDPKYAKWGETLEERKENILNSSYLKEEINNHNFDSASGYLHKLIEKCPAASENIYVNGTKLYKQRINRAQTLAEHLMSKIGHGFVATRDAVVAGLIGVAKPLKLWQHIPHPVVALATATNLAERTFINPMFVLCYDKPIQSEHTALVARGGNAAYLCLQQFCPHSVQQVACLLNNSFNHKAFSYYGYV